MRHGYFIAQTGEMHGDPEFAAQSKALFESLNVPMGCDHKSCPKGEACPDRYYKFCGTYDGASLAQADPEGPVSRVISMRDFFREEFKVMVHMLSLAKESPKTLN